MKNVVLADELVRRLNELCEDPDVRSLCEPLISARVPALKSVWDHPTIQVQVADDEGSVGFLGLINGIVGTVGDAVPGRETWGYVAGVFDSETNALERFELITLPPQAEGGK